jgi:NhaP-type Na+/H+ or K+/H+ antiporter
MAYLRLAFLFVAAFELNAFAPDVLAHLQSLGGTEATLAQSLWCLGLMMVFGWLASKAAVGTVLPSFTLQLLLGIVLHDALSPLTAQLALAVVVCTALAAIILKSGGDELDRKQFAKIAYPTLMIAVAGYLVTFFVMFALLMWLGLDSKTAALLSAIIGSTDPAALIPTLKKVRFLQKYQRVVDISVAESALNDAVGAIFTAAVAAMVIAQVPMDNLGNLALGLFSPNNLQQLAKQFAFGTVAGLVGWGAMAWLERYRKADHPLQAPFDFALVVAIPLLTFLLAQALHGNGFLAAFVAGLLANFNRSAAHFHHLIEQTETQIESVAKPVIFMMVGPFVSLPMLMDTALMGLLVSLLFIFVARPLAVFASLLPTGISFKEKLFLCAVRETGVIPVVLAVITVAQFSDLQGLMPLTAWVVIWTLTLLPAITPWWSRRLNMVQP